MPTPFRQFSSWVQHVQQQAEAPEALRVATFNVQNLNPNVGDPDPSNDDRLDKLAHVIAHKINNPHIIALQEIQDNSGDLDNGVTDGTESLQELVDAIAAQGGPHYAYAEVAPENNKDGGKPGTNIRNAFLYDPARVHLYDSVHGPGNFNQHAHVISDSNGVHLSHNPARIHPERECFDGSRKPLVAEFVDQVSGESIFCANAHLISKRTNPRERAIIRAEQAQTIADYMNALENTLHANGLDANTIIAGDCNAMPHERPLQILTGESRMNLAKNLENGDYYTYIFKNNPQAIDHIIVNYDLAKEPNAVAVHVNTSEPYWDRGSDHDPATGTLNPSGEPSRRAGGMGR